MTQTIRLNTAIPATGLLRTQNSITTWSFIPSNSLCMTLANVHWLLLITPLDILLPPLHSIQTKKLKSDECAAAESSLSPCTSPNTGSWVRGLGDLSETAADADESTRHTRNRAHAGTPLSIFGSYFRDTNDIY